MKFKYCAIVQYAKKVNLLISLAQDLKSINI